MSDQHKNLSVGCDALTPMSSDEEASLKECEETIERGLGSFIEVGNALITIRDGRLHRQTHKTFEAYCRDRWGVTRHMAYRKMEAAVAAENVANCQHDGEVLPMPGNECQARPLTKLSNPDEQRRAWQSAVETAPDGKVTGKHVEHVVEAIRKPHVAQNSGDEEWYTPPVYIEAARNVLGVIDLDPASSEQAQAKVKAGTYFTKADDGLLQVWKGRAWMNPPYKSSLIRPFIDKLCEHVAREDVPEAVVLVNNATDTGWFQKIAGVARAICFPCGRVRFLRPEGVVGAPLQGQAVVYIGNDVDAFAREFTRFGVIMVTHETEEEASS